MKTQKRFDVIALGELLIDFTESGMSPQGNRLLEVNPGGAPCNVLAMLQNLGRKTAFIGKVGQDQFGRFLKRSIEERGINTENLVFSERVNTTLTFVETKPDGDREFSFYRNPGADMMLDQTEIRPELIEASRIFHFGTLSMTHEACREATKAALDMAKKDGLLITFDPNLRPPLWESEKMAREQIEYGISRCDAMKIADNEVQFLTGEMSPERGARMLLEKYPMPLLCLTLGKEGCVVYYGGKELKVPGFIRKDTVETTGAGDVFCACMIDFILNGGLEDRSTEELEIFARFANAAASIITTRRGALGVMPTKEETEVFLKTSAR